MGPMPSRYPSLLTLDPVNGHLGFSATLAAGAARQVGRESLSGAVECAGNHDIQGPDGHLEAVCYGLVVEIVAEVPWPAERRSALAFLPAARIARASAAVSPSHATITVMFPLVAAEDT